MPGLGLAETGWRVRYRQGNGGVRVAFPGSDCRHCRPVALLRRARMAPIHAFTLQTNQTSLGLLRRILGLYTEGGVRRGAGVMAEAAGLAGSIAEYFAALPTMLAFSKRIAPRVPLRGQPRPRGWPVVVRWGSGLVAAGV